MSESSEPGAPAVDNPYVWDPPTEFEPVGELSPEAAEAQAERLREEAAVEHSGGAFAGGRAGDGDEGDEDGGDGEATERELTALRQPAPVDLRVNRLLADGPREVAAARSSP